MKNTNIIMFDAGAYGNFINWLCSYNINLTNNEIPLSLTGNVHFHFPGQHEIKLRSQVDEYISLGVPVPFAQVHPVPADKIDNFNLRQTFLDNLTYLEGKFDKIIYIHTTQTSCLSIENNKYSKIDETVLNNIDYKKLLNLNSFQQNIINVINSKGVDKIRAYLDGIVPVSTLQKWGYSSVNEFPIWDLRELASKFYYDSCHDNLIDKTQQQILANIYKKIEFIAVDQLRDNFIDTIHLIMDRFKIISKNDKELQQIYNQWITSQKHINKDREITYITHCIINNIDYNWKDKQLTIIDEIFIQRQLFDNGFDIKSYGFNILPTNTKDFRKIL
jgi:hypothetical protein